MCNAVQQLTPKSENIQLLNIFSAFLYHDRQGIAI